MFDRKRAEEMAAIYDEFYKKIGAYERYKFIGMKDHDLYRLIRHIRLQLQRVEDIAWEYCGSVEKYNEIEGNRGKMLNMIRLDLVEYLKRYNPEILGDRE